MTLRCVQTSGTRTFLSVLWLRNSSLLWCCVPGTLCNLVLDVQWENGSPIGAVQELYDRKWPCFRCTCNPAGPGTRPGSDTARWGVPSRPCSFLARSRSTGCRRPARSCAPGTVGSARGTRRRRTSPRLSADAACPRWRLPCVWFSVMVNAMWWLLVSLFNTFMLTVMVVVSEGGGGCYFW